MINNALKPSDQRLSGVDTIFLKVEHPRRLMTVTSIWTFEHRLDSKTVFEVLDKLCYEYPRFGKVPRQESLFKTAAWTTPVGWSPEDNVILHTLEEPTRKALQNYCSAKVTTPFDYSKPLWELHAISGLENDRCAFFWKAHHSLADGEGFIRSLLSTTSLGETLKKLEKQSVVHHRPKSNRNKTSLESKVPKQLWDKFPSFITTIMSILYLAIYNLYILGISLAHDLYCCFLIILPVTRKDLIYRGLQSHEKEMAWSEDVSIKDIKVIREAFGGTLNDVMLTVITRCIKSYLESIGQRKDNYINFIIPISLRQPNDWSFRNVVSGTWGFFSMKDLDTKALLNQVRTEMLAIKSSFGPRMLYLYFQALFGYVPGLVCPPMSVYNHFCDIPHGVFTNVPGPTVPITFAGEQIQEYRTFPPQSGKGSIGIALISYCGNVSIGAIADVHRKYPHLATSVCERFSEEFNIILDEARMELTKREKASF